ncbi:MAG: DUF1844 domain-containing protein [Candidatus Eremiobacteraeota bacterium]|nr:DUF1844 domain-containing protein [Candidatus Eremiobacteraeota bacterium]
MSPENDTSAHPSDATHSGVMPMRDLAFSMLSVLVETAAFQMHSRVPLQPNESAADVNLAEARAAIDTANALLDAVRHMMESDARLAIEGMLTQLQIDYVRRASHLK